MVHLVLRWLENEFQPRFDILFDIQELRLSFKLTFKPLLLEFLSDKIFSLNLVFFLCLISFANTHDNAWFVLPTFLYQVKSNLAQITAHEIILGYPLPIFFFFAKLV